MAVAVDGEVARTVADEAKSAWAHVGAVASSRGADGLARDDKSGQTLLPDLPPTPLPASLASACLPIINLGREVNAGDESSANAGFVALFTNARHHVRMITPNLNAPTALAAIADGTKQSDVYVVVSKGFTEKLESLPGQGGGNEEVVTRTLPGVILDRRRTARLSAPRPMGLAGGRHQRSGRQNYIGMATAFTSFRSGTNPRFPRTPP